MAKPVFDAAAALEELLEPRTDSGRNRRVRIGDNVSPQLREWLHRVVHAHASLCHVVRTYARPSQAGGGSNAGNEFVDRAARGCKTLLYDAVTAAREELDILRSEIETEMDEAPEACPHPPGSGLKVETMRQRYWDGNSLFCPHDRRQNLK